jgi:hypothetical protein
MSNRNVAPVLIIAGMMASRRARKIEIITMIAAACAVVVLASTEVRAETCWASDGERTRPTTCTYIKTRTGHVWPKHECQVQPCVDCTFLDNKTCYEEADKLGLINKNIGYGGPPKRPPLYSNRREEPLEYECKTTSPSWGINQTSLHSGKGQIICPVPGAVVVAAPQKPAPDSEVLRLRRLAQAGECGILLAPAAQQSAQLALADLVATYRPGVSTRELWLSFVNATGIWGLKYSIYLKPALAELSPRQFTDCFPLGPQVFVRLAGDIGEPPSPSLYDRLYEIYCSADASRCNRPLPGIENCDFAAANPGDPDENIKACEAELQSRRDRR